MSAAHYRRFSVSCMTVAHFTLMYEEENGVGIEEDPISDRQTRIRSRSACISNSITTAEVSADDNVDIQGG